MADPIAAQTAPYKLDVESGRKYLWCACGRSKKQPICDGSHSGTGITPIVYEAEEAKTVWFCGCKASGKKPLCDGTHKSL
jgi:CDGSH-type Zn-finger protein